jgi:8-demethyl-8-alpha-L-rhamnosyltetracenomycin-C 2'-O-methyltransferase
MSTHAVIFSSFVPGSDIAFQVGQYFLDWFKLYNKDDDIYIGVNAGSSDHWISMIEQSGLRATVVPVEPHLSCSSDVSGYQAALSALKCSGREYDYVWFGHTKGATHPNFDGAAAIRDRLEKTFWSQKKLIESQCDPIGFGTFCMDFLPVADQHDDTVAHLKAIYPSAMAKPIGYVNLFSFFGMTGNALRLFFEGASPDFFTKNIVSELGFNRYFFESGFAWVGDMAGLPPFQMERAASVPGSTFTTLSDSAGNNEKVRVAIEKWLTDKENYVIEPYPNGEHGRVSFMGARYEDLSDFIELFPERVPSLNDIGLIFRSDKASDAQNFLHLYQEYISEYKSSNEVIVQIGGDFNSYKTWLNYFNKANIVCVGENLSEDIAKLDRVEFFCSTQSDVSLLSDMVRKYDPVIVIDDGSHLWNDQFCSFVVIFPLLRSGSIYVIEDLHSISPALSPHFRAGADRSVLDLLVELITQVSFGEFADTKNISEEAASLLPYVKKIHVAEKIAFIYKK